MIRYSRNIRTSAVGSGVAAWEIIAGTKGIRVVEIGITLVNATASVYALGRPAAAGITPTTPLAYPALAGGPNVSLAKHAVAWGTGPTIPGAFFRSAGMPATVGAYVSWCFRGIRGRLLVPAGETLILWTLSAVSIADVFAVIEE